MNVQKTEATLPQIGITGLEHYHGQVNEEFLVKLRGRRGREVFREMAHNDAVIGSMLYAIEMFLRPVEWKVEPFDDSKRAEKDAEFLTEVSIDMSHSWSEFISEWMAAPVYGYAPFEIVWKLREGYKRDIDRSSRFNDGKIGVAKLATRHPDSLDRWEFDDLGRLTAMIQRPAPSFNEFRIPVEKLLLFTVLQRKGSPEGTSLLRRAYAAWFRKKRIEEIEAIGIERELAGLPMFMTPAQWWLPDAPASDKALLDEVKEIGRRVRADEQACVVLPSIYDEESNQLLKFELVSTGGRRAIDTAPAKEYYSRQMAMSVLMDVFLMGHEKIGSFALAQPLDANVLTPTGWKRMGDMQPGDSVVCPTGHESHVIDTFDHGTKDAYRITLADGRSTLASADHKWVVTYAGWKAYATDKRQQGSWIGDPPESYDMPGYAVVTTEQLAARYESQEGNYRFHVPTCEPVDFASACPHCGSVKTGLPLPMDPYILGALLGDGNIPKERGSSRGGPTLITMDEEIVAEIRRRLPHGHRLNERSRSGRATIYKISGPRRVGARQNAIVNALDDLGLLGATSADKYVPPEFLYTSPANRLALLRGLMDADGSANKQGQVRFYSVSESLASDVMFLARSLGGTASVYARHRDGYQHPYSGEFIPRAQTMYVVTITMPDHSNPFLLTRKAKRVRPESRRATQHTGIVSIEPEGVAEMRCIAVSSPSGMYITDDFIPTHNSSDKTNLFSTGLGALLDGIEDALNEQLVPRLLFVNGRDPARPPRLRHGDIETPDLDVVGEYVSRLAGANLKLFPTESGELEEELLRIAGLPEGAAEEIVTRMKKEREKMQEQMNQDRGNAGAGPPFASQSGSRPTGEPER